MNIEQISRIPTERCRDVIKDVMYIVDKVSLKEINIKDEYTVSVIEKNKDVAYHLAMILARLNIINSHTISEIRAAIEGGIPFSEKDYHEDLANGDDVKRSRCIQINKKGKYTTYSWVVANLGNKKGNLIWEVTHNGRKWTAKIPKEVYHGQNSLSVSCDPNTGEPSKKSALCQYFKETT
jgi:hypothetical protein